MTMNLKKLALAVVAGLLLSILTTSSASAAGERFHSEVEPTIVTGLNTNTHVFSPPGAPVECTEATFRGTTGLKTEALAIVHPTYFGCTFLGEPATVLTTGCSYVIRSETVSGKLPVETECLAGFAIKVKVPACTLTFGPQKNTGGVIVTNEGSGVTRDVKVVSETGATFSKSGSLCFLVSGTTGTYKGTATVKGFKDVEIDGRPDEVNAEGKDETAVYVEGAQVGIWWE
jgi:hypothetical protein